MNPRFCIFLFLVLMKELGGGDGEGGGRGGRGGRGVSSGFPCVNLGVKNFSDLPEARWYNLVCVECS